MSRKRNNDVKKAMTKWIMHGCSAAVVFDYQTGAQYSLVQLALITDQNIWNRVRPIKSIDVYKKFMKSVQAAVARVFKTDQPTSVIFWDDDSDVESVSSAPTPTEPPWRPILDIPKQTRALSPLPSESMPQRRRIGPSSADPEENAEQTTTLPRPRPTAAPLLSSDQPPPPLQRSERPTSPSRPPAPTRAPPQPPYPRIGKAPVGIAEYRKINKSQADDFIANGIHSRNPMYLLRVSETRGPNARVRSSWLVVDEQNLPHVRRNYVVRSEQSLRLLS